MHGVATYAHCYMGYEALSLSFTMELSCFMSAMLCYVLATSLYAIVVL